ncbi:MAG TPA: restriction endonuclease [Steroidobacteraceae bacterium]|nr:restriction endonuclease [Steroidobacteraceae bacterium]
MSEAIREPPPVAPVFPLSPEIIVRHAMRALAIAIAREPESLGMVEWRDLERVMREVFEGLGIDTQLTRSAKDGGFDLHLKTGGMELLVELKHWLGSQKRVGPLAVQAFISVIARAPQPVTGLLLSTSGFTPGAAHGMTEVQQHRIHLGGKSKIVSLCQHYLATFGGLWSPIGDIAEMILADTAALTPPSHT